MIDEETAKTDLLIVFSVLPQSSGHTIWKKICLMSHIYYHL